MTDSLYHRLAAAGCEIDHYQSDLYVRRTPLALAIIAAQQPPVTALPFASQIDGTTWLDIPFQYEPFWTKKGTRA